MQNDQILFPIANIKSQILRANQIESSHRLFRAGAKLYIMPPYSGGSGHEEVNVFGKPKNSSKMIEITIRSRDIENIRLKAVYDPKILAELRSRWCCDESWFNVDRYNHEIADYISCWKQWSEDPYSCAIGSSEIHDRRKGKFVI